MSTAGEGEIIPGTLSGRVESARGRQRSCMLHFDKDLQDGRGGERGVKDGKVRVRDKGAKGKRERKLGCAKASKSFSR